MQQKFLSLDLLDPNPWNSNVVAPHKYEKLKAGMQQRGWIKSLIVREKDDGRYEILGGYHRWKVAQELGWTEAPCDVHSDITDSVAKQIGIMDNGDYGEDDPIQLSKILKELEEESADLTAVLHYDSSELDGLLNFSDIDFDDLGISDDDADEEYLSSVEETSGSAAETHQLLRFKVHNAELEDVLSVIKAVQDKEGLNSPDSQQNMGDALVFLANSYKNK